MSRFTSDPPPAIRSRKPHFIAERAAIAGYRQTDLAQRLGADKSVVSRWYAGSIPSARWQFELAHLLGIDVAGLFIDPANVVPQRAPITGWVGPGGEIGFFDDGADLSSLAAIGSTAPCPPNLSAQAAGLVVRGSSLRPVYHHGDLIFYDHQEDLSELVNRECVIGLANGSAFIKTLINGSRTGRWTLLSHNADPMIDVSVSWASRVRWVMKA